MTRIALCVPFARKEEARGAGARWDAAQRVWTCDLGQLNTDGYAGLRPFVPRMYRPEVAPPYIRPWMVPQPLWGRNLRAVLVKEDWDVVRKAAYQASGYRCRVCGGKGDQWPVEADEGWDYDDARRLQTLKGVVALCPHCHKIRHWGKTMIDGQEAAALDRLMIINRWSAAQAKQAADAANAQWQRRSRHAWETDYSWVTRVHGFAVTAEGISRAADANKALVSEAAQRVGREVTASEQTQPSAAEPARVEIPPKRGPLGVLRRLLFRPAGGEA